MTLPRPCPTWALVIGLVVLLPRPAATETYWYPLSRAELAEAAPRVQKDADAEALFWDVHVEDRDFLHLMTSAEVWHYLRIKIFTERGKEEQSTVSLPYGGSVEIADVEGRTVKPDGSVVELQRQDVFDRVILSGRGLRIRAKSFVMPAVEPGDIIEYRWREVRHRQLSVGARYDFQRDIPTRIVTYHFRPLRIDGKPATLRTKMFNASIGPPVADFDGFQCVSMPNVPAFREEAATPPEGELKPWMLVFYDKIQRTGAAFWEEYGRDVHEEVAPLLKTTTALKREAARIVGDATRDEDKLRRLYDFCHTEIRNISADPSGLTEAEQRRLANDEEPPVTLRKRMGTAESVNLLFAALARAADFDVCIALVGDRSEEFFDPARENRYFLRSRDVAVRYDNTWTLHDPGSPYLPFGRLIWEEEGQKALVTDSEVPFFVDVPATPADSSRLTRTAALRLSEDGTLEGEARFEYTGHLAIREKRARDGESPAEAEDAVRAIVERWVGPATVSAIRVENAAHPAAPISYHCRLRVPGYAQTAGRRVLVAPAVFQHAAAPAFPEAERKHPISLDYARSEFDSVHIALPEGTTWEQLPDPVSIELTGEGAYTFAVQADSAGGLVCRRALSLGRLHVPASAYRTVKGEHDRIHEEDTRVFALRTRAAGTEPAGAGGQSREGR